MTADLHKPAPVKIQYTHTTPSGIPVYVVQPARDGWWLMSCGSIIPPEMLKKWENKS